MFDDTHSPEGKLIAAIQRECQDELPIRADQVAQATRKDEILSLIYQYVQVG